MPTGIRIITPTGATQVDETYKNLVVAGSGSVVTSPAYSGATYSIAQFTITANTPIIATRCSVAAAVMFVDKSGSNWTYYLRANSSTAVTINYYVFDAMGIPPAGPGLVVYNASSQATFHSNAKYMRIVDALAGTSANYGTHAYTTGRIYAWVSSLAGFYSKTAGSNIESCETGAANATNGLTVDKVVIARFPGSGSGGIDKFSGLVVDVTDF